MTKTVPFYLTSYHHLFHLLAKNEFIEVRRLFFENRILIVYLCNETEKLTRSERFIIRSTFFQYRIILTLQVVRNYFFA